jgi:hypothetical protein
MAPQRTPILTHLAGWLALAYFLALVLPFVYAAFVQGDGASLGGAAVAGTWTAAPIVAAAAFVGASPGRMGALLFFMLELLLVASFCWEFAVSLSSSTGGFVFFTWPLIQWAAIIVAFLVALLFGWRMRPDFMNDEQNLVEGVQR